MSLLLSIGFNVGSIVGGSAVVGEKMGGATAVEEGEVGEKSVVGVIDKWSSDRYDKKNIEDIVVGFNVGTEGRVGGIVGFLDGAIVGGSAVVGVIEKWPSEGYDEKNIEGIVVGFNVGTEGRVGGIVGFLDGAIVGGSAVVGEKMGGTTAVGAGEVGEKSVVGVCDKRSSEGYDKKIIEDIVVGFNVGTEGRVGGIVGFLDITGVVGFFVGIDNGELVGCDVVIDSGTGTGTGVTRDGSIG